MKANKQALEAFKADFFSALAACNIAKADYPHLTAPTQWQIYWKVQDALCGQCKLPGVTTRFTERNDFLRELFPDAGMNGSMVSVKDTWHETVIKQLIKDCQ